MDWMHFSAPGRVELGGNHTDHQHGCVLAAAIDLAAEAEARPSGVPVIRVRSEGFPDVELPLDDLAPRAEERGTTAALVRGMAAAFAERGLPVGGFDARVRSAVLPGSGLSSSAAFEVLLGRVLNGLFCGGQVNAVEIAKMGQWAENIYFGKPCGLMDQMACAVGGIIAIDFRDPSAPVIEKTDFDLTKAGYNLCIVNTGGNHADLTGDYASVPAEMKAVAAFFGKAVLRDVDEQAVIDAIPALRPAVGDRAILRALHFFAENRRVAEQKAALQAGDLDSFLANVIASGRSSFCYLQNVYTTKNVAEQGLSLALCLAERVLSGKRAAWRVHGGGFAGTIQAFVPTENVAEFRAVMDAAFGDGRCMVLRVRPEGALRI